jgi:CheY-like chemotaxis protein
VGPVSVFVVPSPGRSESWLPAGRHSRKAYAEANSPRERVPAGSQLSDRLGAGTTSENCRPDPDKWQATSNVDPQMPPLALVVEDDLSLGRLLSYTLGAAGIDSISVSTAEEAAVELAQRHIDYALIDVTLPGTSGMYVIESIRKIEKERRPAVVLITATRANILDKIDRSVVKAVMFKPLDVKALVAFVAALAPVPEAA